MKKKIGITTEIVLMIVGSIILFASVISYGSSSIFSSIMKQQMETFIESTCVIARDCVNGDHFDEYLESKGQSENSRRALSLLQIICDDTEFNYLYIIRPDLENGKVLNSLSVNGPMYPDLDVYDVGKITDITSDDYKIAYRQIMNGEKSIAFVYRLDMPNSIQQKKHITGLAPISDSKGKIVGIMCAEATFSWYKEALKLYKTSFMKWLLIILVIVIVACSMLLHKRIVIPFLKIEKETERFSRFNTLSEKSLFSIVKRKNELGQLAAAIDLMEQHTIEYVQNITTMTAEKEKSDTQLKIASAIQLGALPKPISLEAVDLYATMKPALEVGGDFYDFFMIDDKHLALVVADVSGKGVPASLYMMVSKIILRKNFKEGMSPAEVLTKTNSELSAENPAEMFVTCLCGILDLDTKILTFANAGHEKPVLMRNGEQFALINTKANFVLGGMPGINYKDDKIQLYPGDIMFTYTDGIPEAMSPANEKFGNDRLLKTLNSSKEKPLEDISSDINKAIVEFNETAPQFDDITMLIFKIK